MKLEHIGRTLHPLKTCSAHSHEKWELIYNTKGVGKTVTEQCEYPFCPGSILLCPPGLEHYKTTDTEFEDYYLQFTDNSLPRQVYCMEDTWDQKLLQLLRILHSAYHENLPPSVQASLLEALMGILRPSLESSRPGKYIQALQHSIISQHTNADFSLQKATDAIPLNRDHLRRNFKKAFGLTPHEYLLRLRIENAKHMLSDLAGEVNIAQVAYNCGFYDPLYFSRVFKKHTGVAPSAWNK